MLRLDFDNNTETPKRSSSLERSLSLKLRPHNKEDRK